MTGVGTDALVGDTTLPVGDNTACPVFFLAGVLALFCVLEARSNNEHKTHTHKKKREKERQKMNQNGKTNLPVETS